MVPALLKWIGNKQRFATTLVSLFPKNFNDYYEPFLGSGAVLAELAQSIETGLVPGTHELFASDNLPFLIEIFEQIKQDPTPLVDYYRQTLASYSNDPKTHYLEIRNRFNENPNGFDFCLLSRTCYSGVIRFRKTDGYMSTPVGAHRPISADSFGLRAENWHELVSRANFSCCDYKEAMRNAKKGDLIYCDPPYTHSQSIIYGAQEFNIEELWNEISSCKQRGCYVALSINGTRGKKRIAPDIPDGLFERQATVNCGLSMIDRFQNANQQMGDVDVKDLLLMSW